LNRSRALRQHAERVVVMLQFLGEPSARRIGRAA
jgi:hypothetical protein